MSACVGLFEGIFVHIKKVGPVDQQGQVLKERLSLTAVDEALGCHS